jgi:hypothetical protein
MFSRKYSCVDLQLCVLCVLEYSCVTLVCEVPSYVSVLVYHRKAMNSIVAH